MARPETVFQNKVRSLVAVPSDRIEITTGSTVGFPDTVFWPSGEALPVEFKIGHVVDGRLKADFEPTQKLWWRKAVLASRKTFACVGVEGKAVFVPLAHVPELWLGGLAHWKGVALQDGPLRDAFRKAVNAA